MTLNQVIQRINTICTAHLQIRSFYYGLAVDFLADKTTRYPAVFLQDGGARISTNGHATTLNYRIFFCDLVHVSTDTKNNEQDVKSDMLSIAMDIVTQMNNGGYSDWALSSDNTLQFFVEENGDMYAGCFMDFSVRIMFKQDACFIPSDLGGYELPSSGIKEVFDITYIADGTEGLNITIPSLSGKKILLITRENAPIYRVSNAPDPAEYIWDGTTIALGTETNPGERYLILYREI